MAWGFNDECRTACANDPGCPGYTCCSNQDECIFYTDIHMSRGADYDSRKRADSFDIREAKQDVSDSGRWLNAKCYRKATPCPMFSQGYNVQQGCLCRPGFSGRVLRYGERPWYVNECYRSPCPLNSELVGGKTGTCHCMAGFKGLLLPMMTHPYYAGECMELGSADWAYTTTTTSLPGARYWGISVAAAPEDGVYEPNSFKLYLSEDAVGQDLAATLPVIGHFPNQIEGLSYTPRVRAERR